MSERTEFADLSRAACRGYDTEMFFPSVGQPGDEAKAICHGCPVRAACLDRHMFEPAGVFGGMTVQERARYRKARGIKPSRLRPDWHLSIEPHAVRQRELNRKRRLAS